MSLGRIQERHAVCPGRYGHSGLHDFEVKKGFAGRGKFSWNRLKKGFTGD